MTMFLLLVLVAACVAPSYSAGNWDEASCGRSIYPDAGQEGGTPIPFIINGWEARPNEFPWQAGLRYDGSHSCGAVIISTRWILTAAHCVEDSSPSMITVTLGDHHKNNEDEDEPQRVVLGLDFYIMHEDYGTGHGFANDIALLRTAEVIPMNENITSACKPSGGYDGDYATISGWGALSQGGPLPNALQYVNNPVTEQTEFEECMPDGCGTFPGMLGFGFCGDNDRSTCNGDSGGPLVVRQPDDSFVVIGMTSWNCGGCISDFPKVFINASYFADWVDANAIPWE